MKSHEDHHVRFSLGDMVFEYDMEKNEKNLKKHGLPLTIGARVFFDDYRIEIDDTEHSYDEQRYDVIGSSASAFIVQNDGVHSVSDEILFVVYTERDTITNEGAEIEITRLISVRLANNFERGVYYANRR